jgi:hypothetical protein
MSSGLFASLARMPARSRVALLGLCLCALLFVGLTREHVEWASSRPSDLFASHAARLAPKGRKPFTSSLVPTVEPLSLPINPGVPKAVIFLMRKPSGDHSELMETLANLEVRPGPGLFMGPA